LARGITGPPLGCLQAIDALEREGFRPRRVADVGAGTAVLAMAAARAWPEAGPVLAGDNDPVAVETAAANLEANGLEDRVDCLEAQGLDHPRFGEATPIDLILANILKGPLIALAPDLAGAHGAGRAGDSLGPAQEQADEVAGFMHDRAQ
jgi:ribosomal protein L11 methyltransferase